MAKAADTFESFVEKERERINGLRNELLDGIRNAQEQLAALDRELEAIDAYENVKTGRAPGSRKARTASTSRGDRAPRGSRSQAIIDLLNKNADGLGRADILTKLGAKGDKAAEASISNALVNAVKGKKIGKKGNLYVPA